MEFRFNDGGRKAAGFKTKAKGDCVCRAFAIATERPYLEIYALIQHFAKFERTGKRKHDISDPERGVFRTTEQKVMESLGWEWVPTMGIGTGCRVHLRAEELPAGRIVANVSHHLVAVVDGVINDLGDPSRGENRCVYGYYRPTKYALTPDAPVPFPLEPPKIARRLLAADTRIITPVTITKRSEPRLPRYDREGYRIMTAAEIKTEALAMIPPEVRPYYTGIEISRLYDGALSAANSEIYIYFKRPVIGALSDARYVHGALEDIPLDLECLYVGDDTPDENAEFADYDADRECYPVLTIRTPYRPYDKDKSTARWTNHQRVKTHRVA